MTCMAVAKGAKKKEKSAAFYSYVKTIIKCTVDASQTKY